MAYIPLVEHERPRVMLLDFAEKEVEKFRQAGFEAKRSATGVRPNDRDEFYFPYAAQDVEVVFVCVEPTSFTGLRKRKARDESVESQPFFYDLMHEVWKKAGWSVLFVAQNTRPDELAEIGLDKLGVFGRGRDYSPESVRERLLEVLQTPYEEVELAAPQFPSFRGHGVKVQDSVTGGILQRFLKNARMSVLTCLKHPFSGHHSPIPQPHVRTFYEVEEPEALIVDESSSGNILALKITNSVYAGQVANESVYDEGRVLVLPDFGENNGKVALALMQEIIPNVSPHLFDAPQHGWLEQYQPALVLQLEKEKENAIEQVRQQIEELDQRAEQLREEFAWLSGLLVHTGDEFATDVAEALRYLSCEAEEVDNNVAPGERKKEDLHIRETATGYFAIGEAKTTGKGRGAAEEFITKTQTHQNRYAHEHKQPPPSALLFVNYAIDLEPSRRGTRFYNDDLRERLEENRITAVDSVALWELCQTVMDQRITKQQARGVLTSGAAFIRNGVTQALLE